jgi:glycine cleavage system H lipoate-binding protein
MVAIFVALTIVAFLLIDLALQKSRERRLARAGISTSAVRLPAVRLAKGLFHAPNHLWLRVFPDGRARLGLDDFAQKLLGPLDAVESVNPGTYVKKGQPILWIQQGRRKLALRSPVSGKVTRVNEGILSNPSALKSDPYVRGWLMDLEPEDLGDVLPGLVVAEKAVAWLRREGERLKEFLARALATHPQVGVTMADGGLPVEGILAQLDDHAWDECQARFFSLHEIG